jgi:hypothetical protein
LIIQKFSIYLAQLTADSGVKNNFFGEENFIENPFLGIDNRLDDIQNSPF